MSVGAAMAGLQVPAGCSTAASAVWRQVVAGPLGYLVERGHEGPASFGQLIDDGNRGTIAHRAGDQAACSQAGEPLGQDGVADPADPAGQLLGGRLALLRRDVVSGHGTLLTEHGRQRPLCAAEGNRRQRPRCAPEGISTSILEVTSIRIADVGSLIMAEYGHDLVFGTFITPQNEEPHTPVALAQLSERSGLDLVTFQDHPYQPAFLDTWTLMSYVAASTERIKISGNVINLPLRPPVLLARQAASLDLLSGGRFELGLGAGAFWDAIAAMGGPRRSPSEAVAGLSEAIDLIRATWDADRRGGIFADGQEYKIR